MFWVAAGLPRNTGRGRAPWITGHAMGSVQDVWWQSGGLAKVDGTHQDLLSGSDPWRVGSNMAAISSNLIKAALVLSLVVLPATPTPLYSPIISCFLL